MLDFLPAGVATIIVAALVAAAVVFIVVRMVKGRKSSGGPACSGCPNAGTCCHCSRSTKDR